MSAESREDRQMALEEERAPQGAPELCLFYLLFKWALLSSVETTQSEKEPPKTACFSESDMVANAYTLSTQKA